MEHVRAALQKILLEALYRAPEEDVPLLAWPIVCGSSVAEKTRALRFHEGELVVEVPDARWRTQMLALGREYVANLREVTNGRVERLRFVLPGEVDAL